MRHLDPCATCDGGTMRKYATKTKRGNRTRYLKCDGCGANGKEVFRVDDLGRPVFFSSLPRGVTTSLLADGQSLPSSAVLRSIA